jgi:hypothetical protein
VVTFDCRPLFYPASQKIRNEPTEVKTEAEKKVGLGILMSDRIEMNPRANHSGARAVCQHARPFE